LLSVIASLIPAIFAWGCYYKYMYMGRNPEFEKQPGLLRPLVRYSSPTFTVLTAVCVLVVPSVVAAHFSAKLVRGTKYCENCQSFMRATRPKPMTLGCLRALVRALRKGRIDVAGSLLHSPSGKDGEARLYCCHSCSRGYFEVTATYKAEWKGKHGGTLLYKEPTENEETWLAASCELAAPDVQRLHQELLHTVN
jgi:hypothetical protein